MENGSKIDGPLKWTKMDRDLASIGSEMELNEQKIAPRLDQKWTEIYRKWIE